MKLLLLGGTAEARQIADHILAEGGPETLVSLAGATRTPKLGGLPTRIGGFGGAGKFRALLRDEGITHILDATHPFAVHISARSARVAHEIGMPHALVLRPGWTPDEGDLWTMIDTEADAATHVREDETVFLATGRQTLEAFSGLNARYTYCRQIDPPEGAFPFPNGEYLVGRPPFSVEDEVELFTRLGIDWLIVKNAGGEASRSKLIAARQMGLRVLMIKRPPPLDVLRLTTVEAAMDWIRGQGG